MGVESVYGRGTTFWFVLPSDARDDGVEPRAKLQRSMPIRRIGKAERILVAVHEDPRVASMLNRYMEGCRVVGADRIDQAVSLAQDIRALGLIVDPCGERVETPDYLPCVYCSLPSYSAAAHALGASDLLVKPVSGDQLWAAIGRLGCPTNRVLLVDDDPEMVSLLRRMLRPRVPAGGFSEAFGGEESLRKMRDVKPDLVLLDLLMPGMDGRQVLLHMGNDCQLADIPVIIITAESSDALGIDRCRSLSVEKGGGFALGETLKMLQGVFDTLTPGWH